MWGILEKWETTTSEQNGMKRITDLLLCWPFSINYSTVIRITDDGFHSFAQIQVSICCSRSAVFENSFTFPVGLVCWGDFLTSVCLNKSVFQFSFLKDTSTQVSILGWRLLSALEGGHATLSWLALFLKRSVRSSLSLFLWRENLFTEPPFKRLSLLLSD